VTSYRHALLLHSAQFLKKEASRVKHRNLLLMCLLAVVLGASTATVYAKGPVLSVFAASSLTEFMEDAKKAFERSHPGVEVQVNLAGSSDLRLQIQQGAPADVFLSADAANMNPLVTTKAARKPAIFAHNTLAIVVAKRAQGSVTCPADLAKPGLRLAVAAPAVPVGRYTRTMLAKTEKSGKCGKDYAKSVLANVRSEEPNVRAVLTKVVLGEVDAGVVYTTDIVPGIQKTVRAITIPAEFNVVASYPIATLTRSKNKKLAQEFQAFVLSPEGKQLLQKRGFLP
jgi:molybdate transport system substrate-binding protein